MINNKPFIHKFKTKNNSYIYDVNTNEILKVDNVIYDIIDRVGSTSEDTICNEFKDKYTNKKILTALNEIQAAARNRGLFSNLRPISIDTPHDLNSIKFAIENNLQIVILGIIESCNLRCKYCPYTTGIGGRRTHQANIMSFEIAKKAIDYLIAHSRKEEIIGLGFYGGEPLLAFDLIKKCVDYAKERMGDRPYLFNITTNATLMDKEKIDFLVKNNFGLTISLDGPKEIHDKYRVFRSGNGTYNMVMKNIEMLKEKYPDHFEVMTFFNSVIVPPIDVRNLDIFFNSMKRPIRTSLVDNWGVEGSEFNIIDWQVDGIDEIFNKFKGDVLAHRYDKNKRIDAEIFPYDFCIGHLTRINNRPLYKNPRKHLIKDTLCLPGATRLFVSTEGKFYTCERVEGNDNMCLGDVWNGIDPKKSLSMMKKFFDFGKKDCLNCWAVNLCNMCFSYIVHNNVFDMDKKRYHCKMMKQGFKKMLKFYCSILEEDQDAFKFIEDQKIDEGDTLNLIEQWKKDKNGTLKYIVEKNETQKPESINQPT